jgi:hypothetical protein
MSLSPLTLKEQDEKPSFEVDVEKHGISRPMPMYVFNGRPYKASKLKRAIKKAVADDQFTLKPIKDGETALLEENTYYISQGGTFIFKDGAITTSGIWKPIILTLKGGKSASLHQSYDVCSTTPPQFTKDYTKIQISLWQQYHGPTQTLEEINDLMINYSSACDVVAYRVNKNLDLYNVAFVRDRTWICTHCYKEFSAPAMWAQHFTPAVELPYTDHSWHKVHIFNRNIVMAAEKYRCGVGVPQLFHHQNSLADKKVYGSPEDPPKKLWRSLMSAMHTNRTVDKSIIQYWERRVGRAAPTWGDLGDMIRARVNDARKKWTTDINTWIDNDYKLVDPRTNKWAWVKVSYQTQQNRRRHMRMLKELDDTIVARQGRHQTFVPEDKYTVELDFEIDEDIEVDTLKDMIYARRRAPPRSKMTLYIDDTPLGDKRTLGYYGVKGKIVGFNIQIGRNNQRWVEPSKELRTDIVTRLTLEHKARLRDRSHAMR